MKNVTLGIKGMTCSHCEQRVRDVARGFLGVEEIVDVSASEGIGRFRVQDDLDPGTLAGAVTGAGFESSPVEAASGAGSAGPEEYDLIVVGGGSSGRLSRNSSTSSTVARAGSSSASERPHLQELVLCAPARHLRLVEDEPLPFARARATVTGLDADPRPATEQGPRHRPGRVLEPG